MMIKQTEVFSSILSLSGSLVRSGCISTNREYVHGYTCVYKGMNGYNEQVDDRIIEEYTNETLMMARN